MKKHCLLLLLSLFLLPAAGLCISNYQAGDQLYVLAPNGLVLRETANPQGKKLLTLAVGDRVTVLPESLRKVPHSVVEFKSYNIRGFWVKVRTTNGKEGFVFDGYLSRFQAPGHLQLKAGQDTLYGPVQFMAVHSEFKGPRVNLAKEATRYERYKEVFKNGAEVEINTGEGGSTYKITFNQGTTVEEAYLIGRLLWMDGVVIKSKIQDGIITLVNEDDTQEVLIMNRGGRIYTTFSIAD